jgi:hypothetical protein
LDNFSHLSWRKRIPTWILKLPIEKIHTLLKCYLLGDGYQTKVKGRAWRAHTVSRELAYNIRDIALKCGYASSVYLYSPKGYSEFHGIKVARKRLMYIVSVCLEKNAQTLNAIHVKVDKTYYSGTVLNLTVDEDNSYCTLIGAVHNCEHYPREDPRRLGCVKEMARVSRDCVIIITNDADGERTKKRAEETRHTYESMPEKETPYTFEELSETMKKAGLLDVNVERYSDEGTQEYLIAWGRKQ